MKKICKILIIFALLVWPKNFLASSIKLSDIYTEKEYVIDSYDVNIVVNENNTFDITENITAYFNIPKHGIYRKIPYKNTINRLDGSTSTNRVRITKLKVDNEFTTSKSNGNYEIKIGSLSETITGTQKYVISYNYNIGKDPLKDKDEFYFNIIGTEWDTAIGNITFTITMPKNFDACKLGFSSGNYGSVSNDYIDYTVDGNVIKGSYNGILDEKEGLTVRLELPEGYFVKNGLETSTFDIYYILPFVFLLISIAMWYKYGRDEKPVETIEFYPPNDLNSLEIGFIYNGIAKNKDVTSLLIYLANLGYISIIETEEKSIFSKKNSFKLQKLKDYDGNNVNEKLFLDNLFTKKASKKRWATKNTEDNGNLIEVTEKDLYDNFYRTVNQILNNMNSKENKSKIFELNSINKNFILNLFIIITFFIITFIPFIYDPNIKMYLLLGAYGEFCIYFAVKEILNSKNKEGQVSIVKGLFLLTFAFPIIPVISELLNEPRYLCGYIYGILVVIGILYIIKIIPKRTAYGNEMLGKIMGFKTFLETAEKNQLEAKVMENPNYFYDILPYTYVLGVSEKWIKKFETIRMQSPSWYYGTTSFDIASFDSFMGSTMSSIQSAMTSSSSGGGSSGGGSGGGGGGSW